MHTGTETILEQADFMKVFIYTLGCKVNQYESEAMMTMLEESGFSKADTGEQADVIIVNSCTVTAASDAKVRQVFHRLKRQSPGAVAVLTGCMPQAFPDIGENFLEADVVLGTKNRAALPGYILQYLSTKQRIIDITPHKAGETFEKMAVGGFGQRTRAFLKIQDGCNRFCSYCIIPYARGRVRSKPLADMQQEVAELVKSGYREIVLTGINLPAYGQDFGLELCDAVEAACAVPGVRRIRLGSLEPERLTDRVIARFAAQKKLCPQFHLSLQSGCDETLRRMNRHYTTAKYREIVDKLRRAYEDPAITTDIMVGFAGETKQEFESSLRFAQEIGFARTHVFAYSRRPGTAAYDAPEQLTNAEKQARSKQMIAATLKTQEAFHQAQVGKTELVLFEQALPDGTCEGYTENYTPVRIAGQENLQGQLVPVQITAATVQWCQGNVVQHFPVNKEQAKPAT